MPEHKLARLSENKDHIIGSDGQRVEYDDPRIVHVLTVEVSSYAKRILTRTYENQGRKIRTADKNNAEIMQLARKLCSGRECLPLAFIAGAIVKDISHYRKEDEITVYLSPDDYSDCQHGAWPVIFDAFAERLDKRNIVYGIWPNPLNSFLGMGNDYQQNMGTCFLLGDLFTEAENTLRCLAQDKISAMEIFEAEFERFLKSLVQGGKAIKHALSVWADKMAEIPLTKLPEETTKVMIFGGLNVVFVHYPVTDYFIEQGIIPKIIDLTEGILWLNSQDVMRYGFNRGVLTPKKQFSILGLILSRLFTGKKNKEHAASALNTRIGMFFIERFLKQYRKIMSKSGLMVDVHIPFAEIIEKGHKYATYNGFTETPVTTGRYLCSVENGVYDGLISLGSFNCPPAMNSLAVIRPLSNTNDIPYAAIDCEGPWISANQRRLLETIAVQAKRVKELKNQQNANRPFHGYG